MGIVYENEQPVERVILVGISERNGDDTESSLAELAELAATAGAEVVGTVIQNLEHMHPGTYVGTGKLEEIRDMIWEKEATGIICDDELSPIQMRNMEQVLDSKVMDRTLLILDIFAARARTSEGKIQVELAQLKYRASRLRASDDPCPVWAAVSEPVDRVRKSWRSTGVSSVTGRHSSTGN